MFKIISSKKANGFCVAYRCGNKHSKKDRFCSKHRKRFEKINTPMRYTYNLLKSNANIRKVDFDLPFSDFKKWCDETNYMAEKGKMATSASIDRKNPLIGYTYTNLQKLSLSDNSKKMHTDNACPF